MTTPFQPLPCPGGGGGEADPGLDVEGSLVCDVNAAGEVVGTALVEAVYDAETGVRTGTRLVNVLDGTPYVPVGTVQPCREGCCPEPTVLCDVQPDGSTVQFIRAFTGDESGNLESADYALDGVTPYAPTGVVGSCDPFRLCTPSSDQDLGAECGPGESVEQQILLDDASAPLANSVFNDDASADPLCGGTWDRPADEMTAPFPVNESFRNTTFDQPGPVLQGTPPYPDLTADTDGAGAGWLRVADINSGTNGLWQVPTPFPTNEGMNAAITFASHDGTTPGGDGMAFVFTDGSVPAQSIPVGGFGNLGLQNWQGGYVAVVLDEYGQTCTCSQAAQGVIDPNPGPCGFCGNTISIQLAGAARQGASCACCTIASISLAPKALNQTTRATPARLLTSIIEEGGQTYVSASIDWNDGNGPVQYFQRVNVTACAGPPPATLRMAAYGGSGGAFRAIKEMRDAVARPAGISNWRAFPITTDAIPACTQLVNITAEVDVTFTLDDQTAGNGEPEAYLWLVNSVTNAVIDVATVSSLPSQVGNVHHLTVSAAVPPADVPNLRVYVGAESRDDNGVYSSLWENLEVTAVGTGCPATPQRTLAISAPCPIPVAIVSGGGGDGGGGTTVVNTPSTFEDALICMTIAGELAPRPGFRREVRGPDGTITVTFLGTDGLTVTPDGWSAGACPPGDTELLAVCDLGTDPPTPFVRRILFNDAGDVVESEDVTYGGLPYGPVGDVGPCQGAACNSLVLGDVCVVSDALPGVVVHATAVQSCEDGAVSYINPATGDPWPGVLTVVVCPPDNQFAEEILCDAGAGGAQFRRVYTLSPIGSALAYDETLDGAPYVPVGPVEVCAPGAGRDVEQVMLCDDNGPFIRVFQFDDESGLPSGLPNDYTIAGGPYVPVGTVELCEAGAGDPRRDVEQQILCDANGTRFVRVYQYGDDSGTPTGVPADYTLAGAPFVPVGAVGICSTPVVTDFDFAQQVLCDANNTPFIRRFTFNSQTGAVTATVNLTLAGAAFAPVGAVGQCSDCCPQVIGEGCTNVGSGFYTAIRATNGTISLIDSVTGAAVLAANIIACPSDATVRTLTAQARLVGDADAPWSPGADVVGTLTSVTMTVLSGTATLTDQNGTVSAGLPAGLTATWSAEDDNTLAGPTSIDAVGGSTFVHWTVR